MLKLQWEGTDWPKARTPLTMLEVLYGAKSERSGDSEATSVARMFWYFRINGKPSNAEYQSASDAQLAAETEYFNMCLVQLTMHYRCIKCSSPMTDGKHPVCYNASCT